MTPAGAGGRPAPRRAAVGGPSAAVAGQAAALAQFAGLLADPSRAAMCLALLDGRAWTAGELARHCRVAPSTASEHLTRLVRAGLLAQCRQGRHRYLRLADPQIAELLEELAAAADVTPQRPTSLREVRAARELAAARTCYDHLAGRLGVAIFDAMVERGLLRVDAGLALTPAGRGWLTELGGLPAPTARSRRPLLRACLDMTERRQHLAGAAGAGLCAALLARAWLVPGPRPRALRLTPAGSRALAESLGDQVPAALVLPGPDPA